MLSRSAEIGYLARFARIIVDACNGATARSRANNWSTFFWTPTHTPSLDPAVVAYRAYSARS